jgi:hypothetical protein
MFSVANSDQHSENIWKQPQINTTQSNNQSNLVQTGNEMNTERCELDSELSKQVIKNEQDCSLQPTPQTSVSAYSGTNNNDNYWVGWYQETPIDGVHLHLF